MAKQARLNLPIELPTGRERAKYLVKMCRERDAKRDLVSVRIDNNTIKLMPREKTEKLMINH